MIKNIHINKIPVTPATLDTFCKMDTCFDIDVDIDVDVDIEIDIF
jgi:hypothetical protein